MSDAGKSSDEELIPIMLVGSFFVNGNAYAPLLLYSDIRITLRGRSFLTIAFKGATNDLAS